MGSIYTSNIDHWHIEPTQIDQSSLVNALEDGQVVFFHQLPFQIESTEMDLLLPELSDGKSKNISFDMHTNTLKGFDGSADIHERMQSLLQRYALITTNFVKKIFPQYERDVLIGRTSFRPVEIEGRPLVSYRKDDTRLHVDAFPSSPNQGKRILRIFSNIHPQQKPRQWLIGEPFAKVAKHFLPRISYPVPGNAALMRWLKITRGVRTLYDHFMLHLHNRMKKDMNYQKTVQAEKIAFPAQTSWMVYTDQVSHAALSGQHALEQTFYLPITAMVNPEKSPLRVLTQLLGRELV